MYITTLGLVLRETEYKESSRILTVLTSTNGKLTVSAKGARRKKSPAACQLLTLSEMTLWENNDRYTLTESRTVELFRGLRSDLTRLALAAYFADLLEGLSDEDVPNPELMSLGLNALYALSEGKRDPQLIKAAFELRLAVVSGFGPELDGCFSCGGEAVDPVFSLTGGALYCGKCRDRAGEYAQLSPGTLAAMRYIVSCDPKRLYSFSLSEEPLRQLSRTAERYLLTQLGHGFSTLDYYRSTL